MTGVYPSFFRHFSVIFPSSFFCTFLNNIHNFAETKSK